MGRLLVPSSFNAQDEDKVVQEKEIHLGEDMAWEKGKGHIANDPLTLAVDLSCSPLVGRTGWGVP